MKRLIQIALGLALVAALCAPAMAKKLVVAHDTNFKPFEFKGEDGKYTGFDIELWQAVAKTVGVEYELQPMDFNGIIPGLQTGNIDVGIAGITIKAERQQVIDFSDPYYDSGLMILVREGDTAIKSVEDLKGKIVATKTATSSVDFVKASAAAKEVKLFPNNDGMFFELMSGGADAVVFDMPVVKEFALTAGKGKVKTVGPLYQGQSYGIGFPKGSPLVSKVNEALKKAKADGTYDKLYMKWFGYAPGK